MANYNFVKFQRGTLTAYNNLRVKDPDTLYFVYTDINSQYGSLYLGEKLISSGDITVVSPSLSDLTDISLSDIQDGQILVYNNSNQKWENLDLATAIQNAGIEMGNVINNIVPEEGQSDEDALNNITDPSIGDITFIGDNIYIYNGEEWKQIAGTDSELIDRITNLETNVGDLSQLYNYNIENPTTIVNTINEINERLVWGEM